MSNSYAQNENPDTEKAISSVGRNFASRTDYDKLYLSFLSGLINEQDLALSVSTILSNEGSYMLHLERTPRLVNLLVAQTGVWPEGDTGLKEIYLQNWDGVNGRNMQKFWRSTIDWRTVKLLGFSDWIADGLYDDDEDDSDDMLLNLELDLGSMNLEAQRVLRVALILHNLSFEKNNVPVLVINRNFLRFALLCMHSTWADLKQTAYDTLANLAAEIQLSAEKTATPHMVFLTVVEGVRSSDRFLLMRSLDILSQMCSCSPNENIIPTSLNQEVYHQLVSCLTVHDIMLLYFTLEALYALSELGGYACDKIVRVHHSIGVLVSLLTLEPSQYGQVRMKISESQVAGAIESEPKEITSAVSAASQPSSAAPIVTTTVASVITTTAMTPVAPSTIAANVVPPDIADSSMRNWLKATYEYVPGCSLPKTELYADYISYRSKVGKRGFIEADVFANCVREVFTQCGEKKIDFGYGVTSLHYDGLRKKPNSLTGTQSKIVNGYAPIKKGNVISPLTPGNTKLNPKSTHSPILKAQLSAPPRPSSPTVVRNLQPSATAAAVTSSTIQKSSASQSTPNKSLGGSPGQSSGMLIKSLLANKVQQRSMQHVQPNITKMVIYSSDKGVCFNRNMGGTNAVIRAVRPGMPLTRQLIPARFAHSPVHGRLITNKGRLGATASPLILPKMQTKIVKAVVTSSSPSRFNGMNHGTQIEGSFQPKKFKTGTVVNSFQTVRTAKPIQAMMTPDTTSMDSNDSICSDSGSLKESCCNSDSEKNSVLSHEEMSSGFHSMMSNESTLDPPTAVMVSSLPTSDSCKIEIGAASPKTLSPVSPLKNVSLSNASSIDSSVSSKSVLNTSAMNSLMPDRENIQGLGSPSSPSSTFKSSICDASYSDSDNSKFLLSSLSNTGQSSDKNGSKTSPSMFLTSPSCANGSTSLISSINSNILPDSASNIPASNSSDAKVLLTSLAQSTQTSFPNTCSEEKEAASSLSFPSISSMYTSEPFSNPLPVNKGSVIVSPAASENAKLSSDTISTPPSCTPKIDQVEFAPRLPSSDQTAPVSTLLSINSSVSSSVPDPVPSSELCEDKDAKLSSAAKTPTSILASVISDGSCIATFNPENTVSDSCKIKVASTSPVPLSSVPSSSLTQSGSFSTILPVCSDSLSASVPSHNSVIVCDPNQMRIEAPLSPTSSSSANSSFFSNVLSANSNSSDSSQNVPLVSDTLLRSSPIASLPNSSPTSNFIRDTISSANTMLSSSSICSTIVRFTTPTVTSTSISSSNLAITSDSAVSAASSDANPSSELQIKQEILQDNETVSSTNDIFSSLLSPSSTPASSSSPVPTSSVKSNTSSDLLKTVFDEVFSDLEFINEDTNVTQTDREKIFKAAPLLNGLLDKGKAPSSKDISSFTIVQSGNKISSPMVELKQEKDTVGSSTAVGPAINSPVAANGENIIQLYTGQTTLSGTIEAERDQNGVVRLHIESPENSNQGCDLSSISDIAQTLECASKEISRTNAECGSQMPFTCTCATTTNMSIVTTSTPTISNAGQQVIFFTPVNQPQLYIQSPNIKFCILQSVPKVEETINLPRVSVSQMTRLPQPVVSTAPNSVSLKRPSIDSPSVLSSSPVAKRPCVDTRTVTPNIVTNRPPFQGSRPLLPKAQAEITSPTRLNAPKTVTVPVVQKAGSVNAEKETKTYSGLSSATGRVSASQQTLSEPVKTGSLTSTLEYVCEWKNCAKKFPSAGAVFVHAGKMHAPYGNDDVICQWEGCDSMKRRSFSLLTHLQDWHCNERVLHAQAMRRKQLDQQGKTTIAAPQMPPPHPGYAPDAAILAIRRHALQYLNPKELSEEKESALAKSIRLTSALILRNLVTYSSLARSHLKRYEPELAYLAMSPVESSRTIAQCLSELSRDT